MFFEIDGGPNLRTSRCLTFFFFPSSSIFLSVGDQICGLSDGDQISGLSEANQFFFSIQLFFFSFS